MNSCKWLHFIFWILTDHILSKRSLWQDKTTTRTAIRNFWPWHKDPWVWWTCLADYGQNCLILPKNYALFFFFLNKGKECDFQLQMKVIYVKIDNRFLGQKGLIFLDNLISKRTLCRFYWLECATIAAETVDSYALHTCQTFSYVSRYILDV